MLTFIPFLLATILTAFSGSRFRPGAWYMELAKPSWNPPAWLFGPVWTLLYLGIAVAGWLVWRAGRSGATVALSVWVAQLILNGLWSWLFFGLHRPSLAWIDIMALLASIVAFIVVARPISAGAAWLFVPYALWVGFATVLNATIVRLNPGVR